jgi:hypothetical protein
MLALIHRVLHLRLHNAPPYSPLYLSFLSSST